MFGFEGSWKQIQQIAYNISFHVVELASHPFSTIMQSQHDYFFIPTTQKQILI
mgnify:CR=1 FL=1